MIIFVILLNHFFFNVKNTVQNSENTIATVGESMNKNSQNELSKIKWAINLIKFLVESW